MARRRKFQNLFLYVVHIFARLDGQAVTFTATVTSAGPGPTGRVTFKDGATTLGKSRLSGGVATLATSTLAVGAHLITAQYTGDAASATSTSNVVNQVVQ